jgi:alpha-galactosidase
MPIEWDAGSQQLHLYNDRLSYLLGVRESGALGLLHLGGRLAAGRAYRHLGRGEFHGFSNRVGEPIPLECPTPGSGDFRIPALVVEQPDGSTVLDLRYAGHEIAPGKPALAGLPSTYVEDPGEADTVEVVLRDERSGLEARLRYTLFGGLPIVARSLRLRNGGGAPVTVTTAMSATVDLPDDDWRMIQLSGAWARERHVVERGLAPGRQSVESIRGASSLQQNPFIALRRPHTTEEAGEALGFSLVYSGNFLAEVEVEPFGTTRVRVGINPTGFAWALAPNEELQLPEAVLAWTDAGLGDLSESYHRLYRERLARGTWRDRPRPILVNNWEATYFDFDEGRLLEIAASAKELGIELVVLDDGWFGRRDDDTTSLGDWFVDRRKLPSGVEGVARKVRALGMDFGIWVEPEMVSARSELFAAHPDWAIGVPGRPRSESRRQLVLDMSRPEVVDHLYDALAALLRDAPISYVKWDMNRNITEPYGLELGPARQGELFHRYILGVYDLYGRLTTAFPDVLFESCASGGGRFDPGLLAFAPQAWTSDDTDAVERLAIQWGTSLCYPVSSMGAHVATVPNHQVGRVTPLHTRAAVAFFGAFGYELDLTALDAGERAQVAAQVAFYRERRELFQYGRLLRLRSPFEGDRNEMAWMSVGEGARRAVVGWYRVLSRPQPGPGLLRLRGLDPAAAYRVTVWPPSGDTLERMNSLVRGGDELMRVGLFLDDDARESGERGDFQARIFDLEAV